MVMPNRLFRDRRDAGRVLAGVLDKYRDCDDVVVLALPRGGVPVAYEVATALDAPLDVFVVRKLGVPEREEVAMGAIASGGIMVLNDDVVRGLNIPPEILEHVAEREARELLRRERAYRDDRPLPDVAGTTVILVDDGLATGASMRAAIQALRRLRPEQIVVAVPSAPHSTCDEMSAVVDDMVCATTPSPFLAVGHSYWDFTQTTDHEVRTLLRAATRPRARGNGTSALHAVRAGTVAAADGIPDDRTLFDLVGDARVVLIGEASHGTHEFYAARARMTQRLIQHLGFCAVAVEADWPDAYRVNRFVRGRSDDTDAEQSLRDFQRFPTWMWRNSVVLDFVAWLREYNDRAPDDRRHAGFYGLDLYSLYRSIDEVIAYLDRVDPAAASRARERYACLKHHSAGNGDGQSYGYAAAFGAGNSCEDEVIEQLIDLQRHAVDYALIAEDELFYSQLNARVVSAAEQYYRTMFGGHVASWNLRDRHMADTLDALAGHLSGQLGEPAKIVVWAHNSHVGDARATEQGSRGELTLGQLVRQRHHDDTFLLGFTASTGTVTAADAWGGPAKHKQIRAPRPDSVEHLFHRLTEQAFLIGFDTAPRARDALRSAQLERAIGVLYRPDTERQSHYFRARVADQFDAVIHIDDTRAVEPLEPGAEWKRDEAPATYPFAV